MITPASMVAALDNIDVMRAGKESVAGQPFFVSIHAIIVNL